MPISEDAVMSVPSECSGSSDHASLFGRAECFKLFFTELLQAALLQLAHFLHTLLTESARRVRKWRYQLWWAARDNTPNKGKLTATRRQLWKQVSNGTDRQHKYPHHSKYDRSSSLQHKLTTQNKAVCWEKLNYKANKEQILRPTVNSKMHKTY